MYKNIYQRVLVSAVCCIYLDGITRLNTCPSPLIETNTIYSIFVKKHNRVVFVPADETRITLDKCISLNFFVIISSIRRFMGLKNNIIVHCDIESVLFYVSAFIVKDYFAHLSSDLLINF